MLNIIMNVIIITEVKKFVLNAFADWLF